MDKIVFLLFFFICCSTKAQTERPIEKGSGAFQLEKHQFNFNLIGPGFQYEIKLFKNVSASTSLGLGLATPSGGYSLSPTYNGKAKFYHNIERRKALGKSVSGNSADFFAISFNNFFTKWEIAGNMDNEGFDLISLGIVYGIQRTYRNGLHFSIEGGVGNYFRNNIDAGIGPMVNFSFGWTPTKKKKKEKIEWQN